MVGRKRRVIEEDDEGNAENKFDADVNDVGDETSSVKLKEKEEQAAGNDKQDFATSMVDRLKRRAAKTATASQQKSKRNLEVEHDNIKKAPTDNGSPVSVALASKKTQSIPKKPKRTQTITIPKKSNDDDKNNKNLNEKMSLLSEMKKPSKDGDGGSNNRKNYKNKSFPPSSRGAVDRSPSRSSPFQRSTSPTRSNIFNLASSPGLEIASVDDVDGDNEFDGGVGIDESNTGDRGGSKSTKEEEKDKFGLGLRQLVWDGLRDLCKNTFPTPPIRDGKDLRASFLRHKDLKTMGPLGNNVDKISSSSTNQQYDFFDIDDTNGSIIVQPKIPIFPEDFSPGGIQEWPLSWWGIVDPSIGERKVEEKKEQHDTELTELSKQQQLESLVTKSDQTKGDRNRRDNNKHRKGRKRSSKDRREDELSYYEEPHHRDFRHPHDHGGVPSHHHLRYGPPQNSRGGRNLLPPHRDLYVPQGQRSDEQQDRQRRPPN